MWVIINTKISNNIKICINHKKIQEYNINNLFL